MRTARPIRYCPAFAQTRRPSRLSGRRRVYELPVSCQRTARLGGPDNVLTVQITARRCHRCQAISCVCVKSAARQRATAGTGPHEPLCRIAVAGSFHLQCSRPPKYVQVAPTIAGLDAAVSAPRVMTGRTHRSPGCSCGSAPPVQLLHTVRVERGPSVDMGSSTPLSRQVCEYRSDTTPSAANFVELHACDVPARVMLLG